MKYGNGTVQRCVPDRWQLNVALVLRADYADRVLWDRVLF